MKNQKIQILAVMLIAAWSLMSWGCSTESGTAQEKRIAPLLDGMGDLHHEITTDNPLAQRFFDQGLVLSYGFNHNEAERAFRQAAQLDPNCAMAYWGIALVLGPNYNSPMLEAAVPVAYEMIQKAVALAPKASEKEQAFIRALANRYGPEPVADRTDLNVAYANAMREVAKNYPDDSDAAVLFVESLMNLHPWDLWEENGQPKPWTPEILAMLETAMKKWPKHPGAIHFYDEPPTWFPPVRQNYGAILLEAGRAVEAEKAYREDLKRYPENGWSLYGLHQSLDAQNKSDEAKSIQERFENSWRRVEVELKASRF